MVRVVYICNELKLYLNFGESWKIYKAISSRFEFNILESRRWIFAWDYEKFVSC